MRDRADDRIYIVDANKTDANKTDAGPITSLPLRDKLRSAAVLAKALLAMLATPISL